MLFSVAPTKLVGPTRMNVAEINERFGYKSGLDALKLLRDVARNDVATGIQRVINIGQILQTFPLGTEIKVRYSPANDWRRVQEEQGTVIGIKEDPDLGIDNRSIVTIPIDPKIYRADSLLITELTPDKLVLSRTEGPPPHGEILSIEKISNA